MTTTYAEFLARKRLAVDPAGVTVHPGDIHPTLHEWQARIVAWAAHVGRAAIWADTGLGKTRMQLEWARLSAASALIVAPLAVCAQTVQEAARVGIVARYVRDQAAVDGPGIWVTNYEMIGRFEPGGFGAVVLDESSILKDVTSKTRDKLIAHFAGVPRRLACSATPAPNDVAELANHAEFLGQATRREMLSTYFVHDQDGWRAKGHARGPMFRWMSTWAVALRRPSDLGYPDDGYILPGLVITPHLIPVEVQVDGQLFATDLGGVGGRAKVRRETLAARVDRAAALVNESHGILTGSRTKLAACGSPSTPNDVEPSTTLTRPSETGDALRADHKRPTASTCGSTTGNTGRSGSRLQSRSNSETPDVASATAKTQSTAIDANGSRAAETQQSSATRAYAGNSASALPNSTPSSTSSMGAAPSVARRSETGQGDGSTSTTAMPPVLSEEFSAPHATWDSASSATTPSCSDGLRHTSLESLEPWVVWCGLNDEQAALERVFGDRCISIYGNQTPEKKVELLNRWLAGDRPILLTKTSIAGMGLNMQHCARMAFVGMSDSYEAYYQAIRRCYRYGQIRPVHVHIVLSELEGQIATNVARKEREAARFTGDLVEQMRAADHWSAAA